MRKFGLIIGAFALFVSALATLGACSGPIDGSTCVTNEDCPSGEVCHTSSAQCLVQCTEEGDSACRSGESCQPASAGEKGCLPGEDDGDTGGGTDSGMDAGMDANMTDAGDTGGGGCQLGDCPDGEVCNEDTGMCESQTAYRFLQIKDTSENDCSAEDPGADMYAAQVTDSSGKVLGWAESVAYNNPSGSNTYTKDGTVFTGSKPELQEFGDENAMCPAPDSGKKFRKDSVLALGCGGALVVAFQKTDGDGRVELEEGYQVQVWEYGSQCGGTDDASKVSICTAQTDGKFQANFNNGNYATCDTGEAGSGLGAYSFTIESLPSIDN